jgi:hypothetical protein
MDAFSLKDINCSTAYDQATYAMVGLQQIHTGKLPEELSNTEHSNALMSSTIGLPLRM